ncbi:MAG: aminoglycoside phosphotransferase family protein [Clostridia bacterium]|nr:aminoglycoside phosphotransferase family protein [Clostridia bacterium]
MDEKLARKLQQVGEHFNLPGPFFNYEEIHTGNVNHTYRADYIRDDGTGMARIKSYLVQRVNTYAFRDPVGLMDNIDKVTEYIHQKRPGQTCLHFHHTADRKTYLFEGDEFWRICNYVPSVTYDSCDDLEIVRSAAEAFGDFQMILSEFDASQLSYTIPDFHNTRKRYEALIADAQKDELGRVASVKEELDYLLSVQDIACRLTDMLDRGELPLRVTHNDTKINNVLFDEETGRALVVIDLDTVMPGLVAHDFGDAVRFAANFTEEDSEDTSKTGVDLNVFWAFADGFLSQTANMLTENEIDTLALSGFVLACELATRFLDDYIVGDKYFKVKKDHHNVIRTRCQIALAKDMLKKLDAMDAIVHGCAEKYRRKNG